MIKSTKWNGITKGAAAYFNGSNISDIKGHYLKNEVFLVLEQVLGSNTLYRHFWIALNNKSEIVFNKKKMIKFVQLCETTYKQYKIKLKTDALNEDFY